MDWIIAGIIGFASGGFFGFFGMAMLSGRAYERGARDGYNLSEIHLTAAYNDGYRDARLDMATADEVVFTSNTDNEGD